MATKKATKKAKAPKRVRFYGLVKIKTGAKVSFVSAQNKHGWSLGLATGKRTVWLRSVRFASQDEVRRVMGVDVTFLPKKG